MSYKFSGVKLRKVLGPAPGRPARVFMNGGEREVHSFILPRSGPWQTANEALKWCQQELGPEHHRWVSHFGGFNIAIFDEKDAVHFRLTWG